MENNTPQSGAGRIWKVFSTSVIFCLLLATLLLSSGKMIQGQMLRVGENLFGNETVGIQYSFLRFDKERPVCTTGPIDTLIDERIAEESTDEFADLFGDEEVDRDEMRETILAEQASCATDVAAFDKIEQYKTPALKAYRAVELTVLKLTVIGSEWRQILLMLILFIASINTTLGLHHIALRPAHSKKDFVVYSTSMVIANALMFVSTAAYLHILINSDVAEPLTRILFNALWASLFAILTIYSVIRLVKPPQTTEDGSWAKALLTVPLYASMAIITGTAYIFFMDYMPGIGINLGQMEELSGLFLNLALFIWIGMLLKQTRIVDLFLDVVRPFNLSPETLSIILMVAAGILTAYTGASGIFVIAAGAIIYKEVFQSGARRQYALAMTAMSGSLGVVIRPCLLIVVIAALNNQVTTDDLYGKGVYVFVVSSVLLYIFSLVLADQKFKLRSPMSAMPESAHAFQVVSPYIAIGAMIIGFYHFGLETKFDEFTASVILPLVMLAMLAYDKKLCESKFNGVLQRVTPVFVIPLITLGFYNLVTSAIVDAPEVAEEASILSIPAMIVMAIGLAVYVMFIRRFRANGERISDNLISKRVPDDTPQSFKKAVGTATYETIGHIGALILLMGLSISVGGLIESTHVLESLPQDFSSTLTAIMLFTFVLVLVGMVMDPFGAAILVNATIAPIAYANGIHPVHFWIIVLAAFELGYLSPPVALNQLLARQVVGEQEMAEADAEVRHKSFYWRYERWILPFVIMALTLLIVAYVPYFFKLFGWYA